MWKLKWSKSCSFARILVNNFYRCVIAHFLNYIIQEYSPKGKEPLQQSFYQSAPLIDFSALHNIHLVKVSDENCQNSSVKQSISRNGSKP